MVTTSPRFSFSRLGYLVPGPWRTLTPLPLTTMPVMPLTVVFSFTTALLEEAVVPLVW